MIETYYWIWFQLLFGFGTARGHIILEEEPCPKTLYEKLLSKSLPPTFLRPPESKEWRGLLEIAKKVQDRTLKAGCKITTPDMQDYPRRLQHIYSKPTALYYKGDLSSLDNQLVLGLVGARRHTEYGEKVTKHLTRGLVKQGATIVSGLALGIDSISLKTTLEYGGDGFGVQACGLDYDYPKGSGPLKKALSKQGGVLTEYPFGIIPKPYRFHPRNRVLAGLCDGIIVVEAGDRSGALVTAGYALEHNRDLFVAPGEIFAGTFMGSHRLLSQGAAKLVTSPESILEEYQQSQSWTQRAENQLGGAEQLPAPNPPLPQGMEPSMGLVYESINYNKIRAEEIAQTHSLPIGEVLGNLTTLEILGLVKSFPGGFFTLP